MSHNEKPARKQPPPVSFYLGDRETAKERKAKLEAIADSLGETRSTLLQKIADGEIKLVKEPA